jgi:ketosteroid isomerase-like protein
VPGPIVLQIVGRFALKLLRLPALALAALLPIAAGAGSAPPSAAIVAVLEKSAADWNRGDIDAFATSYKNSPDIVFVGREISRGYTQMLAQYRKRYATRAQMGTLSLSHLEVQPLDESFATVTGHFHLDREKSAGGDSDGYFLLVVESTGAGWKIVRDDTTGIESGGH